MDELINKFLNHKILIDVKGATKEDLYELEKVVGLKFAGGQHLSEYNFGHGNRYLHKRVKEKGITISSTSKNFIFIADGGYKTEDMPNISYLEFIKPLQEITEEEFDEMFV